MFIRKFIIMSKQTLKDVKGHIRLEVRGIKGKVSLSVEGIKPKEDKKYKLYAVTDEKHGFKEVNLGLVDVNASGRGKLDLNFNPKSVNKSKIDINGFNILTLKEEDALSGNTDILLAGYIHTEDGTIAKLKKETKTVKKVEVKEEKLEELELPKEKHKKETIEEPTKEDLRELKANSTLDLLKFFKRVKPFKEKMQNENFKWWEIDDDKLNNKEGLLPYFKYISNPPYKGSLDKVDVTCKDQIDKYNKYLFGISEKDGKITHYIYGIPGRHERNEHPYGGKTGFVTWLEDKSNTRNGYWLIYINAYTGSVVRPI